MGAKKDTSAKTRPVALRLSSEAYGALAADAMMRSMTVARLAAERCRRRDPPSARSEVYPVTAAMAAMIATLHRLEKGKVYDPALVIELRRLIAELGVGVLREVA